MYMYMYALIFKSHGGITKNIPISNDQLIGFVVVVISFHNLIVIQVCLYMYIHIIIQNNNIVTLPKVNKNV